MPVDRKLALKSLKRLDQELYDMYTKIKEVADYVEKRPQTFQKLRLYLLSLEAIDDLERVGIIEVVNDYEKGTVYIRRKI